MRSVSGMLGSTCLIVWATALVLIAAGAAEPWKSWGFQEKSQGVLTPAPGSPERKAILDVLRELVPQWGGQKAVFLVRHMKVSQGWAWVETGPRSADGTQHYEPLECLLQKTPHKWEIRECRPCCGDCADDPDCSDKKRYYRKLRSKFPKAPGAIFPER